VPRSDSELSSLPAAASRQLAREVFTDGRYPAVFQPDDPTSAFHSLYAAKRDDVLRIVEGAPGERVLDLGGGRGRLAVPLAASRRVTLADISPEMLDQAASAAAGAGVPSGALTLVELDASRPLPFARASFDIALAIDLLVHLPDPEATLREVRRVLSEGGLVLVDTTNRHPQWMLRYPRYVGPHPRTWIRTWRAGGVLPEWRGIVTHHSRRELHWMVAAAGFRISAEHTYGPPLAPKWVMVEGEAV